MPLPSYKTYAGHHSSPRGSALARSTTTPSAAHHRSWHQSAIPASVVIDCSSARATSKPIGQHRTGANLSQFYTVAMFRALAALPYYPNRLQTVKAANHIMRVVIRRITIGCRHFPDFLTHMDAEMQQPKRTAQMRNLYRV